MKIEYIISIVSHENASPSVQEVMEKFHKEQIEKLLSLVKEKTNNDTAYYVEDTIHQYAYIKFKNNNDKIILKDHVYLLDNKTFCIIERINPALYDLVASKSQEFHDRHDIYTGEEFLKKWKDYDTVYSCTYEKNGLNGYQVEILHKNRISGDCMSTLNLDGLVFVHKSTKDIYTSWVKIIL